MRLNVKNSAKTNEKLRIDYVIENLKNTQRTTRTFPFFQFSMPSNI